MYRLPLIQCDYTTRHKSDKKPYLTFEGEWDSVINLKTGDKVSYGIAKKSLVINYYWPILAAYACSSH